MAYKKTRRAVLRNKPQLDRILAAKGSVRFYTNQPDELAHKLNEAIYAAKFHEEFRVLYHESLRPFVKMRVRADHVLVDKIESGVITKIEVDGQVVAIEEEKEVSDFADNLSSYPIEEEEKPARPTRPPTSQTIEVYSLAEIIFEATSEKDVESLIFPTASLSRDEKSTLNAWCVISERKWNFLDQDEKGLTLTTRDLPEELRWKDDNLHQQEKMEDPNG